MADLIKLILHSDLGSELNNSVFLIFRILVAWELFRVHGLKKFKGQQGEAEQVPNPLHLPQRLNQFVATFSDTVVPFLVMLGIATRLVVLPVIGVTAIGYFVVHRHDSPTVRDVPYMYTLSFLLILFLGAGSISLDHLLIQFFN